MVGEVALRDGHKEIRLDGLTLYTPLRELVEPLTDTEIDALREDVRRRGRLLVPIVIDEHHGIIDGHHRADIAAELGLSRASVPVAIMPGLDTDEKQRLAVEMNTRRRHWDEAAKERQAQRLRALGWSYPQIGDALGVDDETARRWLATSALAEVARVTGKDGIDRPAVMPTVQQLAERRVKVKEMRLAGQTIPRIAAALGISQRTVSDDLKAGKVVITTSSAEAKRVAETLEELDELSKETSTARDVHKAEREQQRETLRQEMADAAPADDPLILAGDFRVVGAAIPNNSVDMIFTDPPYDANSKGLYVDLAKFANRVLTEGGSLLAYVGHYALADLLPKMEAEGLRYWWLLVVKHSANYTSLAGKKVYVCYKPIVWFVKGGYGAQEFVFDLVDSDKPDKDMHDWAQSEREAAYYIERMTAPGQLVVDPFCGSGTTLTAALGLKRNFIGIEADAGRRGVAISNLRRRMGKDGAVQPA